MNEDILADQNGKDARFVNVQFVMLAPSAWDDYRFNAYPGQATRNKTLRENRFVDYSGNLSSSIQVKVRNNIPFSQPFSTIVI